uniref:Cuticle protein 6 n=2 Tax=Stomoxys calcitrans TaxID=35570 RepID=A0A1I8PBK5_STOCA
MKLCFALLMLVATTQAASLSYLVATPRLRSYPYVYGSHATSVITPVQHQYHTQDELGQYAYGYSDPLSSKQEVRSLDGVTRGSYSYRDAEGILQTVDYTADDSGFHVTATNLPKPVQQLQSQQQLHTPESSISDSVSPAADSTNSLSPDTTNSISFDTDSESIAAAGATGDAIYSRSGLRLAESPTPHAKPFSTAANVRSMELSQSLADTLKVASPPSVFVSSQPRNVLVATPLTTVAGIPLASKSLLQKVYGFGYPISKRYIYY